MAVRRILTLPKHEKILRTPCVPVRRVTPRIERLVEDLTDTLGNIPGLGLAAPQIGELSRVAVMIAGGDSEDEADRQFVPLIDPVIVEAGEPDRDYDGCLSIPGLQGYTNRPATLRVRSFDLEGDEVEYFFEGLDARVAAHEIDHLDGVLFLDRLETLDDLFYLVPDEKESIRFLPYLEVHPDWAGRGERLGMPTRGVKTIED